MLSSFNARLRLPGQSKLPLGVEVDISHERMTLTAGDRTVAAWPLEELEVVSLNDGFHVKVDGDDFVLNVPDSRRFAAELGIGKRPSRVTVVGTSKPAPTELSSADSRQNRFGINGQIASPRPDEDQLDDVRRRISDIAKTLSSDSVSPAAAFAQWLRLLKEINRRHGQGSMPTELYYRLNTELLDLIPEPPV